MRYQLPRWLRPVRIGVIAGMLCTLAAHGAMGSQTVEANANNKWLGWTFNAAPDPANVGEASITGIADHAGGSASLNFTLSGAMGNKRKVKLRQQDFPTALQDVRTLSDLTSVSWRIHHSDPLTYPRFAVTLRAKPNVEFDGQWYTPIKSTRRFVSSPRTKS